MTISIHTTQTYMHLLAKRALGILMNRSERRFIKAYEAKKGK